MICQRCRKNSLTRLCAPCREALKLEIGLADDAPEIKPAPHPRRPLRVDKAKGRQMCETLLKFPKEDHK